MAQMRRQSLVKFDAPLCETIVDTPKPQGREVLVRIERCGLCHSDLHIQDGYADLGNGKKLDTTRGMTLPFTLVITGGVAKMNASVGLNRLAFGVGQGEWANTDQIPAKVSVRIALKARRTSP